MTVERAQLPTPLDPVFFLRGGQSTFCGTSGASIERYGEKRDLTPSTMAWESRGQTKNYANSFPVDSIAPKFLH
jgi:hypothetical protein